MHGLRASTLCALLALAAFAAGAGPARAVAISAGTGSALAGQTVDIDINTASLTGLNVLSLQFDLTYNASVVTPVAVLDPAGTLAGNAGWATPAFFVTAVGSSGDVRISAAGTTVLTGAGSLLRVRFLVNPTLLNGSYTGLSLANFVFNEGSPAVTLTAGSISVGVTPQINVSPASGEIVRGQTLQFTAGGSVTNPVAWTTSDNAIATISGTGLLTGVAPGAVTVTAVDAAAHSATTTGTVLVRGMGITAGTLTVIQGQNAVIPISVTSLTGLGIRAGQFTLTWYAPLATAVSVTTPPGTLLNGYGPVTLGTGSGTCTVDFVGSADLAGAGVLCYVTLATPTTTSGGTGLAFAGATFNETLPAKPTNGSLTVQAIPTIFVNPSSVTLLAGQTQQFTLGGSPTPPVTWSVLDASVASINASGLLTALHGGTTRVRAQDAVGAVGLNTAVNVYDFQATIGNAVGAPGSTVKVPITADRLVGGLGIYAVQFGVNWNYPTSIADGSASNSGLWALWGTPASHFDNGLVNLTCAAGGTTTMGNTGTLLASVLLKIAPTATPGTNITLSLAGLTFNEGFPRALVTNGTLQVHVTTDAPPAGSGAEFALGTSTPNPGRGAVRVPFSLPAAADAGEHVRLGVYDLDGRRVKSLVDGALGAGPHEVVWDGLDDAGRPVGAGLFFTRLELAGRTTTRKLTRVR